MKIIQFIKRLFAPKTYEFGMYGVILRDKGYVPMGHLTVEDEIKENCKKNRQVYLSIIPKDAYEVIYCNVRTDEEFETLRKIIDEKEIKI